MHWRLREKRNLEYMSRDRLVIYGMVTVCIKIWSDTYVKVIPVDWLQGKCIVNPAPQCVWDSDTKVAAVETFSVAVKLCSLQTGSFSLVLTHWRRVSFGKTKPNTPPFPFLSQSNPLYVGNTIWMARIIRMHPETAFVVSWYFFFSFNKVHLTTKYVIAETEFL